MKRFLIFALTLSLTALSTTVAWGSPAGFGARAVGMGGAYTAIADDESAAYWNPAGITETKHLRFAAGGGYHGDFDKLRDAIDKIRDDQMPDREDLNDDYSLTALVGLTAKHVGINVYSDSLLTTSQDAQDNISATLNSINYGLVTIAGRPGKSNKLSVGINIKAVAAGYGEVSLPAVPTTVPEFTSYTATTSYNTATGAACDLGFLYQATTKLNLGFTARNLYTKVDSDTGTTTTYSYDVSDPLNPQLVSSKSDYNKEIPIPKSYVFGLAFRPFKHTLLAADVENITDSDNDQTRLHAGLEQNALWNLLSLRLGYFTYKDDNKEDSTGYTAGVGFNLWILNCSAACVDTDDDRAYMATANIKF
jgi:hypothetical protein